MKKLFFVFAVALVATSCTTMHHTMREPNARVELNRADFDLSEQVVGQAERVTIFGLDFARMAAMKTESGSIQHDGASLPIPIDIASIPVVGSYVVDPTANYALYVLMANNPGYDVVFYPQFETEVNKPLLFGFLMTKTTVTATARLGKLK